MVVGFVERGLYFLNGTKISSCVTVLFNPSEYNAANESVLENAEAMLFERSSFACNDCIAAETVSAMNSVSKLMITYCFIQTRLQYQKEKKLCIHFILTLIYQIT